MRLRPTHILTVILCLTLAGCGTDPVEPLPGDVSSYQYRVLHGKRFYEVTPVPPTGAADTVVDSVYLRSVDTVIWPDSSAEIRWVHSYRAIRRFRDSSGILVKLRDTLAVIRQVGIMNGRLYDDPSITDIILREPLTPGASWPVRADSSLTATVVGEEELFLRVGPTRTYHVTMEGISESWWTPDLGRVQYEEINRGGQRVLGVLIALGAI